MENANTTKGRHLRDAEEAKNEIDRIDRVTKVECSTNRSRSALVLVICAEALIGHHRRVHVRVRVLARERRYDTPNRSLDTAYGIQPVRLTFPPYSSRHADRLHALNIPCIPTLAAPNNPSICWTLILAQGSWLHHSLKAEHPSSSTCPLPLTTCTSHSINPTTHNESQTDNQQQTCLEKSSIDRTRSHSLPTYPKMSSTCLSSLRMRSSMSPLPRACKSSDAPQTT